MSILSRPDKIQLIYRAGEDGLIGVDATTVLIESKKFEISGTSVADGNCTWDGDHGLKLTTSSAAADQVIVLPSATADNVSPWREITWGTANETEWECVLRTDSLTTTMVIVCGLTTSIESPFVVGDNAEQAIFKFLNGTDTNWQINNSIGSSDTTADTGVPVVANTVYHFAINIDSERLARYFINGVQVHTSPAHAADVDLLPCVAIQEGSADPAVVYFRSMAVSRILAA